MFDTGIENLLTRGFTGRRRAPCTAGEVSTYSLFAALNLLKTKRNRLCIRNQTVPRSKLFALRL